jgi:hypothetical protein
VKDQDAVLLGSTASGDAGEGAPRRKDSLFPNRDGLREFLKAHDKELCEDWAAASGTARRRAKQRG